MARAPKPSANALVPWDEQLAKDAEIAAGMEANSGGGQFFSFKSGILSFNDMPMPNNEMAVIILDSIFENVFYEGEYDPNNPTPPTCFAFGREELTVGPHQAVIDKGQDQHTNCQGCPMNQWGTAEKGRGKACRNTRRLGVIPAGEFTKTGFSPFTDTAHYKDATVGFMKLPVTSIKGYATFVKQVAGGLKRPPYGIFTRVKVVPDAATQFKVVFEALDKVPDGLMQTIVDRRTEVMSTIDFPYSLDAPEQTVKPAGRGGKTSPVKNVRPAVKKKY